MKRDEGEEDDRSEDENRSTERKGKEKTGQHMTGEGKITRRPKKKKPAQLEHKLKQTLLPRSLGGCRAADV